MTECVQYKPVYLEFDRSPTWDEAVSLVSTLTGMAHSLAWWVGDFFSYASRAWPETWTQLIPDNFSIETLRNWVWVAERYPRELRELPSKRGGLLPWSVYQACAGLDEPDRVRMIHKAADEGLSTGEIRALTRPPKHAKETICPSCGYKW